MSLLKTGDSIRRRSGATVHLAPALDDEERARRLVATPSMIDVRDGSGRTALHRAAQKGKSQVCLILLEGGANAGIRDLGGLDAAALARLSGYAQVARLISDHLAAIEAPLRTLKIPPLTSAEIARLLTVPAKTVEGLIAAGRRDACDARDNTLLHIVAKRGALLACERLFAAGISTTTLNKDGKTAADVAEAAGHVALAEMLRGKELRFDRPKAQVVSEIPFADFDFEFGATETLAPEEFHHQGGFGEARPEIDWGTGRVVIVGEEGAPAPKIDLSDLGEFSIVGEGIGTRDNASNDKDAPAADQQRLLPAQKTFLETRTRGRRSRKTARPSELAPVALIEADCRDWLAEVVARGHSSPGLVLDLIDLCHGGWDDDLHANIVRFLEDCGFETEGEAEGFDICAELDMDEMVDGLMALCNRSPVLAGRQAFALSAEEERRMLGEIRRCTAATEAALAADDVSRSAIISLGRGLLAGVIDATEVTRIEFGAHDPVALENFRGHLDDLEILHDDLSAGVQADVWMESRMVDAIRALELLPEIMEGLAEAVSAVDRSKALPVIQAVHAQRSAIHAFLGRHLPWVRLQASREAQEGEEVEDVFQNAWLGMRRALVRFVETRGTRFMTYSSFWMKQFVQRARQDETALVRIPVHRLVQLFLFDAVRDELGGKGVAITPDLLSERTGYKTERLMILDRVPRHPLELDENDPELASPSLVDEGILDRERTLIVRAALDDLAPRRIEVIKGRFGFDDQDEKTLEELGQAEGVTRERIRQIEAKALEHLAHPSRLGKIRKYL